MTLDQYLSEKGETDTSFAARVGISQPQISRLRRGVSRPSWSAIEAITKNTEGKVTANDWQAREAAE